jgi:hypothetical protein
MTFSEVQLECVADTANALGRAWQDKLAGHSFIPFLAVITLTAETVSALHRTRLYERTHTHEIVPYHNRIVPFSLDS